MRIDQQQIKKDLVFAATAIASVLIASVFLTLLLLIPSEITNTTNYIPDIIIYIAIAVLLGLYALWLLEAATERYTKNDEEGKIK